MNHGCYRKYQYFRHLSRRLNKYASSQNTRRKQYHHRRIRCDLLHVCTYRRRRVQQHTGIAEHQNETRYQGNIYRRHQ